MVGIWLAQEDPRLEHLVLASKARREELEGAYAGGMVHRVRGLTSPDSCREVSRKVLIHRVKWLIINTALKWSLATICAWQSYST